MNTTPAPPRPGDIGLTSIAGGVGRLIRLGQFLNGDGFHNYQHAFVVIGRVEDMPGVRVVEAMPYGALNSPLSRYDGCDVVYLRCPPDLRDLVSAAALSLVGTPYSFLDYASLALRRLRIPAQHLRAFIASSNHMICSQLCDEAAKRGGWHLFDDGRWSGDVTPGDLYQLWRSQYAAR